MAEFRIDIEKITGNPTLKVGIYIPFVDDNTHQYGIANDWEPIGEFPAWYSNVATTEYGGDGGIDATRTTTVYVQCGMILPPRVGVQIGGDKAQIKPSLSVENFFDFDGRYVYSIVVI